jgi:propanol-preferring alcohol dehydrogenase
MKAARLHEFGGDFVIEDVPTPSPKAGEVLIRVGGAGACHSDLHVKTGEIPGLATPLLMGHENAGWVETLGSGVEGLAPGDPVAVFGGWGCGRCRFCLGGQEQLCDTFRWGGMGPAGGYAEYLLVPSSRHLLPIGDLDPVLAAPLTDAALTPYAAVKKVLPKLVPGSTAVLIGAGGLGQYAVQFLRLLTEATVVVVDTSADKRASAQALGADHVIDPADDQALNQIKDIAGGEGAAAVLDLAWPAVATRSPSSHCRAKPLSPAATGAAATSSRKSWLWHTPAAWSPRSSNGPSRRSTRSSPGSPPDRSRGEPSSSPDKYRHGKVTAGGSALSQRSSSAA